MKYFTLSELTSSPTAERLRINNTPPAHIVDNLIALVDNVLDPLREIYGAPIRITSGYRCPQLNKALRGSPTSQHLLGQAADITSADNKRLFDLIRRHCRFDQVINERPRVDGTPTWVHISFKSNSDNRHEALMFNGRKYIRI